MEYSYFWSVELLFKVRRGVMSRIGRSLANSVHADNLLASPFITRRLGTSDPRDRLTASRSFRLQACSCRRQPFSCLWQLRVHRLSDCPVLGLFFCGYPPSDKLVLYFIW